MGGVYEGDDFPHGLAGMVAECLGGGGPGHGHRLTMQDAMKTDWTEVYRASRYAFSKDGSWRVFALDGSGPPMADLETSVTLVSAWNPGSLELPEAENRAANALGRHYPGGRPAFVEAMNRKARELGMHDTRYVEPTGLSSRNRCRCRR